MSSEELRKILHAAPFQPFKLHLADGRAVRVPHPDFLAVLGQGQSVIVTAQDETLWDLIDLSLVTDVEVEGASPASR